MVRVRVAQFLICILALGAGLVLVTALGQFGPIRAYPNPPQSAVEGPLGLAAPITDVSLLYRGEGEPLQPYLARLSKEVADGMVHYWHAGEAWQPSDVRHTSVGLFDNYLLWLRSFWDDRYKQHEFITPAKAIARGYGFCSQVSFIVYSILIDQGYSARVIGGAGHVIVESEGSILDADYGVFIPHDYEWLNRHPEAVADYYAAYPHAVPHLTTIYSSPWREPGPPRDRRSWEMVDPKYLAAVRNTEESAERWKWRLPAMMILIALAGLFLLRPRFDSRMAKAGPATMLGQVGRKRFTGETATTQPT